MNPYAILGLTYPSTREEIKARYHELALKKHPDKLLHLPEAERNAHEQEFKKINIAYELLTKSEFEYNTNKNDWTDIASFFNDPDLLRDANDIVQNIIKHMKSYTKKILTEHYINVDVTLEEVYTKKIKRLRLFLNGCTEPIFINVNCADYPFHSYKHKLLSNTHDINITFNLLPHDIFSFDTLFESKDVFCNLHISLYEYLYGGTKDIEYLDKSIIRVRLERCSTETVEIANRGIDNKGNLLIFIKIVLPEKAHMEVFNDHQTRKFKKYVQRICEASSHSGIL
jgi:DnaJ-class molecular chaperone